MPQLPHTPMRQDQRYDSVPSSVSFTWFSASRTTQSLGHGTSYSSKVGAVSCSGRYRATCSVMRSAMCALPPVDTLARGPAGDGDRQVLDLTGAVGLPRHQRVREEPVVVPRREVQALVRPTR